MSPTPISVVIPTLNEEANIAACLASVAWAEERLVVDAGSCDRTVAEAEKAGARVLVHPWSGYGAQKDWAAAQASHEWILSLDADERVSAELRDEIRALARSGLTAAAYRLRRESWVGVRRIRHGGWGRDFVSRLYHRDRSRWSDRLVHERLLVDGPLVALRGALVHHTYRGLGPYLAKAERYAELGARELHRQGRRASAAELVLAPLGRFLRMYVLQAGVLDGEAGFVLAAVAAWGVFAKYAHLRELVRLDSTPG